MISLLKCEGRVSTAVLDRVCSIRHATLRGDQHLTPTIIQRVIRARLVTYIGTLGWPVLQGRL